MTNLNCLPGTCPGLALEFSHPEKPLSPRQTGRASNPNRNETELLRPVILSWSSFAPFPPPPVHTHTPQVIQPCLDFFRCHDFGGRVVAAGPYEAEARNSAKHPAMHSTGTLTNCLVQNGNSVSLEKPWCKPLKCFFHALEGFVLP